jgi:hypothetical protein
MERTKDTLGNRNNALLTTLVTQLEALLSERQQVQTTLTELANRGYVDTSDWWATRSRLESISRTQERVLLSLQALLPPDGHAWEYERELMHAIQPATSA